MTYYTYLTWKTTFSDTFP